jgi:branched-subunit amino acid aminotransferase/4-amino-4-deoxychorismate lyase
VLIWVRGEIVPEGGLAVPVSDRVFEHGLGLFETLRTFHAAAPLLPRHLARMTRSAGELGLPFDVAALPDQQAIRRLLAANEMIGDAMIRITLSGGTAAGGAGVVWMRAAPLPPPVPPGGAVVGFAGLRIDGDPLARHKTLNYWSRRLAYEQARTQGADEVVLFGAYGNYWEGSRTNLFLIRRQMLVTPGLDGPVLPGIMRALVLELAASVGLKPALADRGVSRDDLLRADEVFLTNAVRGIIPVGCIMNNPSPRELSAPGAWTARLRDAVEVWLQHQGSNA